MGMGNNKFRKVRYPSETDEDWRKAPGANRRPIHKEKQKTGREACGKARYSDEYEAAKKLAKAQKWAIRNGFRVPVRYYYHKKCGGYHLTSQEAA
jgi:hypothetical protein